MKLRSEARPNRSSQHSFDGISPFASENDKTRFADVIPRAIVERSEHAETEHHASPRLVAVDQACRRHGVQPGMTLVEARARQPQLAVAEVQKPRLEALEASIFDALATVSPRLGQAPIEAEAYLVEVSSLDDVDKLSAVVADLDLGPVSIGVADGAFAAWCAARVAATQEALQPQSAFESGNPAVARKIVPRGGDAEFIAPLPSTLLPTSDTHKEAFSSFGLLTIGHIAALSLEDTPPSLGEDGGALVALARGAPLYALATYSSRRVPTAEVEFSALDTQTLLPNENTHLPEAVLCGLRAACLRLALQLVAWGQGIGEAEVVIETDSQPLRVLVRPTRPNIDPDELFALSRAGLETILAKPVSHAPLPNASLFALQRLRVTATTVVSIESSPERLAFIRRENAVLPLDVTLARLRGQLGDDTVVTPVRVDNRGAFRDAKPSFFQGFAPHVAASPYVPIAFRERFRTPSPAIGVVLLSRAPAVGDAFPVRAIGLIEPRHSRRIVAEVSQPEVKDTGNSREDEPYELFYHWVVSNDGVRALFARTAEQGGWRLVGLAD